MTASAVQPPKSTMEPFRDVDCLFALMPAFRELVGRAEGAGWSAEEVALSLLTLASVHESRQFDDLASRYGHHGLSRH